MREQLEVARREHAELARSMDVNERLLTMRDAYIAVLEEAKGLGVPRACAYDRPCLARLEPMFTMGQHAVVHCSCFNGGCTGWNVDRELSERCGGPRNNGRRGGGVCWVWSGLGAAGGPVQATPGIWGRDILP